MEEEKIEVVKKIEKEKDAETASL